MLTMNYDGSYSREHGRILREIICTLLFCISLVPIQVIADTRPDTVHFVEEANWPPYTPNSYGIATEGLALELMEAIFSQLDIKVELELLPWERALLYLKTGKKDGASVLTISPERQEYIDYTIETIPENGFIYYHSGDGQHFEWQSFEDLKGLQIGVVAGNSYGPEFNQAAKELNLNMIEVPTSVNLFNMLLAKRIDIVLCSERNATDILKDSKFDGKISHTPNTYFDKGFHIGFSKKSKAKMLIPEVNKVIEKMRAEGAIEAIVKKYF